MNTQPETILQFGAGNFLRVFADQFPSYLNPEQGVVKAMLEFA